MTSVSTWQLRAVLALLLALVQVWPQRAVAADFQFGVGLHLGTNWSNYAQVDLGLRSGGFNAFRDEVFWHRLELKPGDLAFPDSLSDLDRLVREASSRGVRPLIILNYGNKHYDDGDLLSSEEALDGFARYVRYVVRRYLREVDQFEIWNEWNIGLGSPRKPRTLGSATAYAALVRRVAPIVRSENPRARVVVGAVAGLDDRWIDQFFATGALALADGFSVHPYVIQGAPNHLPETAIAWLDRLREKMLKATSGPTPTVLVTEMGWPTNEGRFGVSESRAAAYFARFMLEARARPWIEGVWWYTLADSGDNPREKEHRFGLLRRASAEKPAMALARWLAPLMKGRAVLSSHEVVGTGVRVVRASLNGDSEVFAWLPFLDEDAVVEVTVSQLLTAAGMPSIDGRKGQQVSVSGTPIRIARRPNGEWEVRRLDTDGLRGDQAASTPR